MRIPAQNKTSLLTDIRQVGKAFRQALWTWVCNALPWLLMAAALLFVCRAALLWLWQSILAGLH
ncbi:hypothetical protein [Stenoxybacter acetivorans]|uniref:hypothetical protein n=1 Tax=Stenoxybacter acetivorans TaxID=422441 RepID=UPI00055D06BF|nr:hypothetical protein [Stenoxybacter acetivorans]